MFEVCVRLLDCIDWKLIVSIVEGWRENSAWLMSDRCGLVQRRPQVPRS